MALLARCVGRREDEAKQDPQENRRYGRLVYERGHLDHVRESRQCGKGWGSRRYRLRRYGAHAVRRHRHRPLHRPGDQGDFGACHEARSGVRLLHRAHGLGHGLAYLDRGGEEARILVRLQKPSPGARSLLTRTLLHRYWLAPRRHAEDYREASGGFRRLHGAGGPAGEAQASQSRL